MDISIIIPVYNTEIDLLQRCFKSVRLSPDIAYEVIIVDDGSGPETAAYCQGCAAENDGFLYYRQENTGVSAARNAGISRASGKYVMFVDSDDELLPNAISKDQLQKNADIIFYDADLREDGRVQRIKPFNLDKDAHLDNKDVIAAALLGDINPSWAKLFRRAFLTENQIAFSETMLRAEDAYFVVTAVFAAKTISYVSKPAYCYHHNWVTDVKRIKSFPYETVENVVRLYTLSKDSLGRTVEQLGIAADERILLHKYALQMLIKRLFNIVGVQVMYKAYKNQTKELVLQTIKTAQKDWEKNVSALARVRCFLLKKDMRIALFLAAHCRKIYMRIRK